MRGKPAGCEGESDVPSAGTWTSAPPARGSEDPGPVPALPTLRTGSRPYADLAPTYYLGACPDAAIALTFDDGPWRYTNDLLDILKQNDVKVTFFVVKNKGRISEHTNVLRRAVNEGHVIGSHTWSHRSLANLDEAGINDEMQRLAAAVHAAIGVYPTLMRPPFGAGWRDDRVRAALGRLGYHVVLYGIDSLDFLIAQGDRTVQETMDSYNEFFNAGQGGVITLAHDVVPSTVYTLAQRVIDLAKSKGYRFVTVDECVNHQDPKGWAPYSDTGCASDGSCEGL
ncbi:hypothetical protein DFJ74DRAFT_609702 [Hyaloraphidium curvatum]|nr:hypothetical protein DFJ74DRAFT_609702 [Hyaloraphidium curvatum]